MSNRFDSGGSFSGTFARPTATSATNPNAYQPPVQAAAIAAATPLTTDGDSKGAKKGPGKTKDTGPKIEFEGNRFGVSPLTIGLLLGLMLVGYGIFTAVRDAHWSSSSGSGEIREYKRMIRPMDLPGR